MKKLLLTGLLAFGIQAHLIAATDVAGTALHAALGQLKGLNPEQKMHDYLAWTQCTSVLSLPPSLKASHTYTRHDLAARLTVHTTNEETAGYYRGVGKALDLADELVRRPVTSDDIKLLAGYCAGNMRSAVLRADAVAVSRRQFNPLNFHALSAAMALINRNAYWHEMMAAGGDVALAIRAFKKGDHIRGDWMADYSNAAFSLRGHPGGASLELLVARFCEKNSEAGEYLFDISCTSHAELPGELEKLCVLINETIGMAPSEELFIKAEQIFIKTIRDHYFEDANGRLARMLVNIVLVRAGLLPVVFTKERFDNAVDKGLRFTGVFAATLAQQSVLVERWYTSVKPLTEADADCYFATGTFPSHHINEYHKKYLAVMSRMAAARK